MSKEELNNDLDSYTIGTASQFAGCIKVYGNILDPSFLEKVKASRQLISNIKLEGITK